MKEVQIGYGMTETSPISTKHAGTPLKTGGYRGTVQDHLEIKIVDPETAAGPQYPGNCAHVVIQ
jgi:fatty-acyl-CoA synthase